MTSQNELYFLLALQGTPRIGDLRARKMIEACGSAEAVFSESPGKLMQIAGIGSAAVRMIREKENLTRAGKELHWIESRNIRAIPFTHPDFPFRLNQCPDGPLVLFVQGDVNLNPRRCISIVGTRRLTREGREFCEQFVKDLLPYAPVIVSGYAYGADICAHLSAVENGLQTIACMAHGLGQTYPYAHRIYNDRILKNGGFITDFWGNEGPERDHFLRRNRIIAGISEAVVVVESAEKGGSLVTADIANSYDREVFAVPGSPGEPFKKGCNALIKKHRAHLLESAEDLVYMLGWDETSKRNSPAQPQLFPVLDPDEEEVYEKLHLHGKMLIDDIALSCQMPVQRVSVTLLGMEMRGVVRPLPGKYFEIA
ncbi:DNA-processing protein DprA [Robertkochia flava]|uniref:DNA-processing protein DprA n=1 Tax=Robertkochia flava TaxID=3447986 RepID=UPI001CCE6859|nr:DNA-processing protein DprA [Robertkochia marina]